MGNTWRGIIILTACIGGWILYELYGRTIIQGGAMVIRLLGGGLTIAALVWYASRSPESFQDTLGLAKHLMKEGSEKYVSEAIRDGGGGGGGGGGEKRNVTGLMKKKIAAGQQWKCGECSALLDETYEVDHRLALYKGGSNDPSNLVALCPHCHRKKTVDERLTE